MNRNAWKTANVRRGKENEKKIIKDFERRLDQNLTAKNPERIGEELEDNSMRPFTLCVAFSSEDAKGPPIANNSKYREREREVGSRYTII